MRRLSIVFTSAVVVTVVVGSIALAWLIGSRSGRQSFAPPALRDAVTAPAAGESGHRATSDSAEAGPDRQADRRREFDRSSPASSIDASAPPSPSSDSELGPLSVASDEHTGRASNGRPPETDSAIETESVSNPRAPVSSPGADRATENDTQGVAGRLLTESGVALPGVRIGLVLREAFGGNRTASFQESVTDGAGRFAFSAVAAGNYDVSSDETEAFARAVATVPSGTDAVVLVARAKSDRTILVHGVVESARGGPLAGVVVRVNERPTTVASSDASGAYVIHAASPRDTLRFTHQGYREQRVALDASITLSESDIVSNVRLEPLAGAAVTGTVRGDDGSPVAGATVQLRSRLAARVFPGATDRSGRFVIRDVDEASDYTLWVHPTSKYKDKTIDAVQLFSSSSVSLDVVVESVGHGVLRGAMIDAAGRPLPGFTLWLSTQYGAGSRRITSDDSGRFVVTDVPAGAIAFDTRSAPQLSVTGVQLAGDADVNVPLDVGSNALQGVVTNGVAPVAGARVSLQWTFTAESMTSRSVRETVTDSDGRFVFTRLGPGLHSLVVTGPGFRSVQLQRMATPDGVPIEVRVPANAAPF